MFKTVDKERFITLMAFVVVLSAVLGYLVDKPEELKPSVVWSLVEHGALGLTIFIFLFTKVLWKLTFVRWLGMTKFPNLAGRWIGKGQSTTFGTEYKVVCTVKQDAWTIDWDCEMPDEQGVVKSWNKSMAVEFATELRSLYLYIVYRNDRNPYNPAQYGADHYGACRLAVIQQGAEQRLIGNYWTNKETNGHTCSIGVFELVREKRSWFNFR